MRAWSRITVLFVGLMALVPGVAHASTWSNSGDTAFTSTGSPSAQSISITASTSLTFTCYDGTLSGTAGTSSAGPAWVGVMRGTLNYRSCTVFRQGTLSCTYSVDALAIVRAGPPSVVATNLVLTSGANGCVLSASGHPVCTYNGVLPTYYSDPLSPAFGRFDVAASSQMVEHITPGGSCVIGGDNEHVLTSALALTLTSASGGLTAPHLGPSLAQP